MNWLQKLMSPRERTQATSKGKVPEGLWEKCAGCGAVLYRPELERNLMVCPKAITTPRMIRMNAGRCLQTGAKPSRDS